MIDGLNKNGADWTALKRHLSARIDAAMIEIVQPRTPADRTEFLRGQIDAYRGLIADAEPVEIPITTTANYD